MIAATGAGVAAIEHEFFGAQPGLARFFVQHRGPVNQLVPSAAGVQVHLDHPRIWRDGELVEPRISRRRFAFDNYRQTHFLYRSLNSSNQLEVILHR